MVKCHSPSTLQNGNDISLGIGQCIAFELVEAESLHKRGKSNQTTSKSGIVSEHEDTHVDREGEDIRPRVLPDGCSVRHIDDMLLFVNSVKGG